MSNYVDGFVIPIPRGNLDNYTKIAQTASQVWKDHGALDYWECVGEDFSAPDMIPFPELARAKEDETVVFAWIVYRSREHRDEVNAKVMADPRMQEMMKMEPVFDCRRMSCGGFKVIVHD